MSLKSNTAQTSARQRLQLKLSVNDMTPPYDNGEKQKATLESQLPTGMVYHARSVLCRDAAIHGYRFANPQYPERSSFDTASGSVSKPNCRQESS
ncbi:hypothetical protein SPHINGOT1_270021 [Sphingomonas sp. T1]|nr:hypothetical protein SPHINGOT1_270021 [Sphingomonas sp. T1]